MPISKDEFEAGGEPAMPVLELLRSRPDEAFSFGELAQELHDTDVTLDDLDYALAALVRNGVVESDLLESKIYYMYKHSIRGD